MTSKQNDAPSLVSIALMVPLNLYFWFFFSIVTISFFLFGTPLIFLFHKIGKNPRKTRWLIRRTISRYGAMVVRCGWPLVRVKFIDLCPSETPPFVFVANHRSTSDGFLMGLLPEECIQLVNNWPYKVPGIGLMANLGDYIKIREIPFDEFMEKGQRLLSENVSIIAFPEGTRSGTDRMGPFHGAAFRLAQKTGVKLIPIAISGNQKIPPRGSLILRPGRITVSKLPALTPEQYRDWTPFKFKSTVHDSISGYLENHPA